MSFASDYNELKKKRKKQTGSQIYNDYKEFTNIAPTIRTIPSATKKTTQNTTVAQIIAPTIAPRRQTTKTQTQKPMSFDEKLTQKYSTMSLADIEKEYARVEAEEKAFKDANGGKAINYLSKIGSYLAEGKSGQSMSASRDKSQANIDKLDDLTREKEIISIYRKKKATEEYLGGLSKEQLQLLDDVAEADEIADAEPLYNMAQSFMGGSSGTLYLQTTPERERGKASREKLYGQLKEKQPDKSDEELNKLIDNMVELRRSQVNAEEQAKRDAEAKEKAKESAVSSFILSRGANLVGGATGLAELYMQRDNEYGYDTNAYGFAPTNASNTIDEQIMLDHDWKIDVGGNEVDGFDFFYKAGTGIVDNLGRLAMSGGNSTVAGMMMFSQGTTQTIIDSKEKGYSDAKALTKGLLNGTFEALTEKFSLDLILKGGGSGLKQIAKSFAVEGSEEITSNWLNRIADTLSEGKHSDLAKMYEYYINEGYSEAEALTEVVSSIIGEDFETFLISGLAGSVMGGGVAIANSVAQKQANKLTDTEQSVVDKVVENRVAEAEADGKKLTNREKNKIYDDVIRDLDKGYISTDTIGEMYGGEAYTYYKKLAEEQAKQKASLEKQISEIKTEYDELYHRKGGDKSDAETDRQKDLKEQLDALQGELKTLNAKSFEHTLKMNSAMHNRFRGTKLAESYNEWARSFDSFKADYSKFKDAKNQDAVKQTLENAEKSNMNNTNKMRDLVESHAKFSADTGLVFHYKSGEEIKNNFIERQTAKIKELESIAERTPEQNEFIEKLKDKLEKVKSGKIKVNGEFVDGGVVINLDSPTAFQFTTGHEITHKLEKAKSYESLMKALKRFAGEDFDRRVAEQMAIYEGVSGYDLENLRKDVEREVVADLVGEYLFTDTKFINNLSTENPNLFKRIYDEIKYLCKIATIGSKEARELERVKRAFEKAYKESANTKADTKSNVRHSLSAETESKYNEAVKNNDIETAQKIVDDVAKENGYTIAGHHGTLSGGFTVFEKRFAKVGSNSGAGFYFSNNLADSTDNYSDVEGADNYFKASELADHIMHLGEWNDKPVTDYDEALKIAKEEITKNPTVYNVYLKMDNPYIRNFKKSTNLYDALIEGFDEDDYSRDDYDSDDDYEEDMSIRKADHLYKRVYSAVLTAWDKIENGYDYVSTEDTGTISDLTSAIVEIAYDYERLDWDWLKDAVEQSWFAIEVSNDDWLDSADATSEFIRAIIEELGYDSIIDKEVSHKFNQLKNMDAQDTEHYIIFNSNQIKSAEAITYDDNGNVIPLSERFKAENNDIRYSLSAEQEDYFKDSVVRDDNGNLKVMYHGTSKGGHTVFDTFGESRFGLFGAGTYFTDNKDIANSYTEKGRGNSPQVYEAYLNITNPIDMDAKADIDAWKKAFADADYTNCTTNEDCFKAMKEVFVDEQYPQWEAKDTAMDVLQSMGYDGITHIGGGRVNADGTRHQVYIAFEPEQIKNIDNIAPTKDADIRYSLTEDSKGRKLTKEQQDFFAESKIRVSEVDGWKNTITENGALLPVYHGTNSGEFFEFDKDTIGSANDYGWFGKGFYFAFTEGEASFYGNRVLECYLDVKKPFVYSEEMYGYDGHKDGDINFDFASFVINVSEKFPEIAKNTFVRVVERNSDESVKKPFTEFAQEIKEIYNSKRLELVEVDDMGEKVYEYRFSRDVDSIDASDKIKQIIKEKYVSDLWTADWLKKEGVITREEYNEIVDLFEKYGDKQFDNSWLSGKYDNKEYAEKNRLSAVIQYLGRYKYGYIDQHLPHYYMESYMGDSFTQELRKRGYDGILQSRYGDEIVVFDSNQIKLTSNKKPTSNPDIRYSLSAETEYNEAVKNNDIETAQKLVDEVAEKSMPDSKIRDENGKLLTVYHGSSSKFTVFDHNKMNANGNAHGRGFYFTEEKSLAEGYQKEGGQLLKGYLNITNPMSEEEVTIKKPQLVKLIQAVCEEEAKQMMADGGYDSVQDALRDTWISGYVYTYGMPINKAYKDVADIIFSNDNDVDIVAEMTNVTDTGIVLNKVYEVLGYDGVVYTNERGTHEFISLVSNQFKSAEPITYDDNGNVIPLSERFNEQNKDIRYSLSEEKEIAPTFYSQMGRVVDGIKQEKIGASSVVNYLKGKGVKNEEIKWSGIEEFVEGKKSVTKQELQEFVANSMLQIEETTLEDTFGEIEFDDIEEKRYGELIDKAETLREELAEWWNKVFGGELPQAIALADYRETSRVIRGIVEDENLHPNFVNEYNLMMRKLRSVEESIGLLYQFAEDRATSINTKWSKYKLGDGSNYRELLFKMPNSIYSNDAMKSHWAKEGKGVLAHARVQDMTDTEGNKVLFIEEIQSDWHNEGAKQGYQDEKLEAKKSLLAEKEARFKELDDKIFELKDQVKNGEITQDDYRDITETFRKEYTNLYIEVDNLREEVKQGKKLPPDAPFKDNYHEFVLKNLLREATEKGYDKIAWTTGKMQEKRWSDEFAEGYRIEYDQDIPKFLNKYGKKWGAKVGTTTLNGTNVHSMDITDSMKNSVLYEGQPFYSLLDADNLPKLKGSHLTYGEDIKLRTAEDIAPVVENTPVETTEQVAPTQNVTTAPTQEPIVETAPIQEAPTSEYEAIKPRPEKLVGEEEQWAKNKMARADKVADSETDRLPRRAELHSNIMEGIKTKFFEKGFDFDKVLGKAKNLSTFATVDNTPQRVMEKALGYKEGQILADETVNKVAQNETEGIKWLNNYVAQIKQISKEYNIKPNSNESASAQMYAEGFYVDNDNNLVEYGDRELAIDFPDARVRENIRGLAKDPRIRQIYDDTLTQINASRIRNAYPEIPRLDNYFLHFRAMEDTFSRLGLPFNPNDIRAKDLPTDLNGVTADLKPGQPYFASAMHRTGKRTSFDLLGGLEKYLSSAKNQIYHIDDIQTLRALRNYIADTYGQAKGLEKLDSLTEDEAQERIQQVYGSHLSTFAKFLNEEANVLAGKTTLIDRGIEGVIGRRGITFLDTLNKQVGSNMVGFNVSSSLTNILPVVQTFAKTNKFDFTKAFAQTVANKIGSIYGKNDGFAENSPVIIRRKGADRFARTPFQKIGDTGYVLMSAVDDISTEIIARTKYNELTRKGMDSQQAHFETDKWVSRLMGDRSLGQQPQVFNSKMLGMFTKFQLEVRNQLDSQFYDTVQEAKASNEEIENALLRNAKTSAKVTSTFFQLAVAQHIFGKVFESIAGYNPAFDIINVLATALGFDDDEEDEDTALDNLEQGFLELLEDLPYTSTLTGGRIPISSALPVTELIKGVDQYGNEKSRWETLGEIAPYYVLPTGYGQIKKTVQGLGMFSDEHPIAGSYTDSGNLRFPVEDTLGNRIQSGIFGQWSNKNARDYFDNERAPLKEKQIQEFIDVDIPIQDYWKYRDGLAKQEKLEDKFEYINGLDLSDEQKNVLINNIVDRKEDVDMSNYDDFSSYEEFDFYTKNKEKYEFLQKYNVSYAEYTANEDTKKEYNNIYEWYKNEPEKVTVSKAVTDNVIEYRGYTSALNDIHADKDRNGNSIRGTAKEKKLDYINSLDIDYGAKLILFKNEYNADDTYNYEIIEYLDSRDDISWEEEMVILKELGFNVRDDGYIWWD